MALTAAELVAYMRLDKSEFDRSLSSAESSMQKTDGKFKEWSKGMGTAAANTIVAGTAAAGGLAATVFATGVSYNTLQQQSRAALATIMGGAEEANAQMDKLDEFAKSSPFAKDVFIQAQQQLLGFGMEAENVLPTLGAIQDAVAAVGGGNQEIAEIANILAVVEGTGKITAETFNQLGVRGVDAAAIIGKEMGKTGAEIRESVTNGTLEADDAIEALTTGMTKRFGGAAENVKETMVGAADRIKAALRDTGSHLAAPFVDPNGGGLAVRWANEFADVLRAVEKQAVPFTDMMMRRFAPGLAKISEGFLDAKDAVKDFDMRDLDTMLDRISTYAPGVAAVSGALSTMALKNVPLVGGLATALGPIPAALVAAAAASPEARDALGDLWGAVQPLTPSLVGLAETGLATFTSAIEVASGVIEVAADLIVPLVEGFNALPDPIKQATIMAGGFIALRKSMPDTFTTITGGMQNVVGSLGGVRDAFRPWGGMFEGAAADALSFRTKLGIVSHEVGTRAKQGFRGALGGVVGFLGGPWGIALTVAAVAVGNWAQKQREAKQLVQELTDTLDEQTGAFTDVTEAGLLKQIQDENLAAGMENFGVSMEDIVRAIRDEGDAYDEVRQNVIDFHVARGRSEKDAKDFADQAAIVQFIDRYRDALSESGEEIRATAEAQRNLNEGMDEGQRSFKRFNEALTVVSDDTKTMEERVRALKTALDELNGGTKTQEERQRAVETSGRDLLSFFEQQIEANKANAETTDEAAAANKEFKDSIVDATTGQIAYTDEGNRLNDMLQRMREDMLEAALEASDLAIKNGDVAGAAEAATAAMEPYREKLSALAEEGYLTKEQVAALSESMFDMPEVVSFLITDNASIDDQQKKLIELHLQIDATPDKTITIDEPNSPEIVEALKTLGYEVETLPDGKIRVTQTGAQEVGELLTETATAEYKATIDVDANLSPFQGAVSSGISEVQRQMSSIKLPTVAQLEARGRFHGGIDVKGMAKGAVTGSSVMNVAEMVKPGQIRFAGDRSDVDEAWIPLDGSRRSVAILQEAIARMPGFVGMYSGGVTGRGGSSKGAAAKVTPPQVEAVGGPDTSKLTGVWDAAMAHLLGSTVGAFSQIEQDTAEKTGATAGAVASGQSAMVQATVGALAAQSSAVTREQSRMTAGTTQATQARQQATAAANQGMTRDTAQAMTTMRAGALTQLGALTSGAQSEMGSMRAQTGTNFDLMRAQGVAATQDLRAGVVSEMDKAKPPFTGKINDLVGVLAAFSSSVNAAFGDMGVKVGSPVRLATGGVLPGYTPGRDVHSFYSPTGGRLELSGGESIMRPEVTRAMGSGWVNQMNAAARRGGVSAVRTLAGRSQAFANGGIFDGHLGSMGDEVLAEHIPALPDNWMRPAGKTIMERTIQGVMGQVEQMLAGAGWVRPTTGRVTSGYGTSRGRYPHAGMDIAAGEGTPTVAPTAGIVADTGWNIGPGRTGIGILVEHLAGMHTYYGHNPVGGVRVKPGDMVMPGQRLGAQGNTGNSTGAHLHWEVHQQRAWNDVDPMPYWLAAGGGGAVSGAGGGSDRWAGVIRTALARNGLPTTDAYVSAWLRQVQSESGGNPGARQRVNDINMRLGRPAQGLLQVIPPTFAAYAHAGHGNILNPLDNALAAVAYAKCVPLDTTILTQDGWKRHDEVQVGDKTVGYNPETGKSEWTTITAVHHYDSAPVVRMKTSRMDVRSTPNHRWVTEKAIQSGSGGGPISRYEQGFTETMDIGSRHRIVAAAPLDDDSSLPITLPESELLGWIMGDGCVSYSYKGGKREGETRRGALNVMLSQSHAKPEYVEELEATLQSLPHSAYRGAISGNHWTDTHANVYRLPAEYARDLLDRSGYESDPSGMILAMSDHQRAAFLRGLMLADGTMVGDSTPVLTQNDGWKMEVAKLAIYLTGHYGKPNRRLQANGNWRNDVSLTRRHLVVKGPKASRELIGSEPVWCVTTDLGSWTMQQDHQVMLTGNSRYGGRMLSVIGRGHGYANGVNHAEPGWHMVGERGPELMRFRGGETVRNNAQSRSLVSQQRLTRAEAELIGKAMAKYQEPGSAFVNHGTVYTRDEDALAKRIDEARRRRNKILNR